MDTLAAELLTIWERGQPLAPAARALHLLALVDPAAAAAPEHCSVGQRDALLMRLRERFFGDRVRSVADCPACATRLELNFALGEVRAEPPGDPTAPLVVRHGAFRLRVRPPTADDLVALEGPGAATRLRLLARCVLEATAAGHPVAPGDLPDDAVVAVAERLAKADPQADVQLALSCTGCGHGWSAAFDIVTFLWRELDAWARRLLYDVHTLAQAYGWREHEVLALSPERRAVYLELVRGMSDFLTNLIARSAPAPAQLTPRLPSRFEPAVPFEASPDEITATAALAPDPTRPAASDSQPPSAPPIAAAPRPARTGEAARRPAPLAPPEPPASAAPRPARTGEAATRPAPLAPPEPPATRGADPPRAAREAPPPSGAPGTPAPASAAPQRARPLLVRPAARAEPPPRVVEAVVAPPWVAAPVAAWPAPAARPAPADAATSEVGTAPLERHPLLAAPRLLPPPGTQPPLVPYAPPRPPDGPQRADPQAVPQAIHVTIGRVEVRATVAAPTPQREPRRTAVMPLDEYLRARRGGG